MPCGRNSSTLFPFADLLIGRAKPSGLRFDDLPFVGGVAHAGIIGQIVQFVKDNMSRDRKMPASDTRGMNDSNRELLFNEALIARTQDLRRERGWTAEQMATALGVPVERYRKYEKRTPLPAYLWEPFCLIVDCDLNYLLTGRRQRDMPVRETTSALPKRA